MKIRSVAVALGAVLFLGGAGVYGFGAYLPHRAEERVALLFEQLPPGFTATHGAVSCGWFCDPLVVEDVAIAGDGYVHDIRIGRMTVAGLKPGAWESLWGNKPQSVRAATITLDRSEYDMQRGLHQSMEQAVLTAPHLDARRDPSSFAEWFRAFSLRSAEITGVRFAGANDPRMGTFDVHAASRSVSGVKNGRVTSVVDKDIAGDIELPEFGGKVHMEIAEGRSEDVDLAGWNKVFSAASYDNGPRDPAFYGIIGNFVMSGLKMRWEVQKLPVTVSLDSFSFSDVNMRQLPYRPDAPPKMVTLAQALEMLRSFSLGGVEFKKLAIATESRLVTFDYKIDDFVLKFGQGGLQRGAVEGVSFRMPGLTYSLGIAELDGFAVQWPGLFDRDPSEWAIHPPGMPKFFFDRYHIGDLAAQSPFGGSLSLKDLTATMSGTIDKPSGGRLDMSDLAVDLTMLSIVKPMRKFGYGTVTFAAHGEAKFDPAAKTFEIAPSAFGAPEMGKISAALRLSDVSLEAFEANNMPAALGLAAAAIRVDGGEMRYDDASLLDHVFAVIADNHDQTPEAARQATIDAVEARKQNFSSAPRLGEAFDQVIAFLREGGSLRLSVKPATPVTLGQLVLIGKDQPEKVLELLGVGVDRP